MLLRHGETHGYFGDVGLTEIGEKQARAKGAELAMNPLEARIRYKFRNSLLLAEALTHPSLGHETQRYHFDNQRLEFLGDAVLELVVTEYLYANYSEPEGILTNWRSSLVRTSP